ncbi:hypothetical protein [Micromonospora carbonacea]|uniref:Uncharacterized protein n=1 Tax=Micromonospora carbonacea TaxID=47853 RepID=A0A1C5ABD8_9ACTN|nr:hypothetical protein [Micromonospora carbonacea]SCF42548.1 hypothetical protein GA0070563_11293 [Micromonospora carbonacea]
MDTLPNLGERLTTTAQLADPLARYQALRDLAPEIKAAIAAEQDAAIAAARDTFSEEQTAEQAGVSVSEVRRRITAHRKRVGPPRGPGRPPAAE